MTAGPRDVIAVLEHDHQEVETMLAELRAALGATSDSDRAHAGELFERLAMRLVRHLVGEETQVEPALRARTDGSDGPVVAYALEEIQAALQRLHGVPADDPLFEPGLAVLERSVAEHCAVQRTGLFPRLRSALTGQERAELGGKVEAVADVTLVEMVDDAAVPVPEDRLLGSVTELFDRVRAATSSGTGTGL
jgi:Hemerythrin HHE cation binding domain